MNENKTKGNLQKAINFITKLSSSKREKLMSILKKVNEVQSSNLTTKEKAKEIKRIMWSDQSTNTKLFIGAFLGAVTGLFIFGTGGIGIAALGTGVGVWGWLATAAGGAFISSLIQNYEKKENED
ncbi:hypothetical protein [Mesoflavibacter sp. SCSIO 43206]|uniref:hypothetical protein n=1 Tax=Mesoflavibacter sp. SCSIO 43206 TaxID=2779362 RepID=UPI001CAA006C|nr:hypothetical protein [Mesoflavibacter sp. SCSIO 43206]UAB74520.1 hypothetical protein INR78_08935 [Mesoflavibacter sp. SCSIO 43206]